MKKIVFSFITLMLVFSATACASNKDSKMAETSSVEVPSLFADLGKFKEVNVKDYLLKTYDRGWPSYDYYFKTPTDISCLIPGDDSENYNPGCWGYIPGIVGVGSKEKRSITVMNDDLPAPSYLADLLPSDSPHVYLPGNKYSNVKLLPVGYKIHFDKPVTNLKPSVGSTCAVPDKDSLGCINTVNHGFLITKDATIVF